MKVLLAEDQRLHARLLTAALKGWGFEVSLAEDGEHAWRLLLENEPPRIAILDWMMPGASGVELCRRIRSHPSLRGIYIILLTARDTTDDLVEGLGAGANDFVAKPFEPRELKARVEVGARVVALEQELARRLSELREAHAREVAVGERIQQALLLGTIPDVEGLDVAAMSLPSAGVDGDFYDFILHDGGRVDIVVGDVMGKGVPAALLSAATKALFLRALASLTGPAGSGLPSPAAIVGKVSGLLGRRLAELEKFATLCYARFDVPALRIDLVDAGHMPTMIVRRKTGELETLAGESPPLGILDSPVFVQTGTSFGPGDLFLFYSDGVTDARNAAGELFGTERLAALVKANAALPSRLVVRRLRDAVLGFKGDAPLADDLTCVVVRVSDGSERRRSLEISSDLAELTRVKELIESECAVAPASALGEEGARQLVLAVFETATNVMKHSYHGRTDGQMRIELEVIPTAITVRVHHEGDTFDPRDVELPSFDGSRDGGFGLFIIGQCVDDVQYEHGLEGAHTIVLTKALPPAR